MNERVSEWVLGFTSLARKGSSSSFFSMSRHSSLHLPPFQSPIRQWFGYSPKVFLACVLYAKPSQRNFAPFIFSAFVVVFPSFWIETAFVVRSVLALYFRWWIIEEVLWVCVYVRGTTMTEVNSDRKAVSSRVLRQDCPLHGTQFVPLLLLPLTIGFLLLPNSVVICLQGRSEK